jgi:UDP-N-acetylglucosamine 4-epimerase
MHHALHQITLGRELRRVTAHLTTDPVNVSGFLNLLVASRNAQVQTFTYSANSSTYGDHSALPKGGTRLADP